MSFSFVLIAVGIVYIMIGYMVKQQKWVSFHLSGIWNKKVDVPKYAQFVYKIDWLFGVSYIIIGSLSMLFDKEFLTPAIFVLIVTLALEIYASVKFKA